MTTGTPHITPVDRGQPDGWGLPETAGVWVAHLLASIVWGSLLVAIFYSGDTPDPLPIRFLAASAMAIWVVYVAGPILVTKARGNGPVVDLWARAAWSDIPIGLVLGGILQWLVLPLVYWPLLELIDVDPSTAAEELVGSIDGSIDALLLTFVVVVGAPFAEEFFYRGMLLQAIRRRSSDLFAVLASAAVFALIHVDPILYPGTFVLGVVAAAATLRVRRLGLAVAMHVGFNGATLLTLTAL